MAEIVLLIQLAASLYMTGLIWYVQLVSYPHLAETPASEFPGVENRLQARTVWAVGPAMLVEMFTASAMFYYACEGVPAWVAWAGLALLALVDGSTAVWFGPLHGRLSGGYDAALLRRLVATNWVRTIGWTGRGLLMLYALWRALVA